MVQRTHHAALIFYLALAPGLYAQAQALGRISFPVSASVQAQRHFIRGVLLLHSFEYQDARGEFMAAQKVDANFAMAYWGEAMTYNEPVWFAQDPASARAALHRLAPTVQGRRAKTATTRERAYLSAVEILYGAGTKEERDFAYSDAMQAIHEAYPGDAEAALFYALSLIGTCHRGRDPRVYMRAAAIAEEVAAKNPDHPGALHYLIHCYDDPVHAPLGLRAARRYAGIAPESAHARHMPSHIFFGMGMWPEAAIANESAWNWAREKAGRSKRPVEAGGYHALWWLEYAYLQQGRYSDARRTVDTMGTIAGAGTATLLRFHLIQMRAMYSIETGKPYEPGAETAGIDLPAAGADLLARGITALNTGNKSQAEELLRRLQDLQKPAATSQASDVHRHVYAGDLQMLQIMGAELAALLRLAEGKSREAVELLKSAVALEEKTVFEFGPPQPPKPAHELLGEMLLQLNQPALARVQLELALLRSPKRALSLLGLARSLTQSGNSTAARKIYGELRAMWSQADPEVRSALEGSLHQN